MRLVSFLILVSTLTISAKSYSQKVNLSVKDATIESVLDQIRQQTGYSFMWSDLALKDLPVVDISIHNSSLGEAIAECLVDLPLTFDVYGKVVYIKRSTRRMGNSVLKLDSQKELSAMQEITGVVRDEMTGEPLAGVTIVVKGGVVGTVTDSGGQFSLDVDENAILEISFVGYSRKEVSVRSRNSFDIFLTSAAMDLNQLVVLGYSTKRRSEMASAVSVISNSDLNDVTSDNIGNLLQGKAAGLVVSNSSGNPNSGSDIIIRGMGSINAGASPLYVVDGIVGGDFDPQDVESVSVLKDAASTALYGSRASNGVIVVTTKTGKEGRRSINFSSSIGFSMPVTGNFRLMNSQQLYDYEKSFYPSDLFEKEIPESNLSQNTNWFDLAFRTAVTQNYRLSYSGGSDVTKVYLSGTYYDLNGTLRFNTHKRYNFRSNINQKINDKIKFDVNMNADFSKTSDDPSGSNGALYGAYLNIPWDNPFDTDGSIKKAAADPHWFGREHENFLYGWQYNLNEGNNVNLNGDFNLHFAITSNLEFASYNRITYGRYSNELYYDTRTVPGKGIGYLTNGSELSSSLVTSNRLSYVKSFGKHTLDALFVVEGQKDKLSTRVANGQGLAPDLHIMDVASTISSAGGNITEVVFNKELIQVNYSFEDKYFFVGSLIDEASSRFGKNNRSALFYSGAASWLLSNENFLSNNRIIDLLKVRMSYGITGNANIDNYQSLGLYSFSTQYSNEPGSRPFQVENDNLTWEKAKKMNIGFDIDIVKRISLNIDIYNKITSDLLLDVELPYTSGFGSMMQNVGSIRNRGLEAYLNTNNLRHRFKWNTQFNIAFNKNKVLSLSEDKNSINYGNFRIRVGQDMNTWYMREWAGVDPENGDPLWYGDDHNETKINSYSDAVLLDVGTASPNFTGGMRNEFKFDSFSLSAFFNFVSGNLIYNNSRPLFDSDGAYFTFNSMVLADEWKRWESLGDIATHPKPLYGGNKNSNKTSSRFLEKGSYIRFRNISLSYSIPKNLLNKFDVDNATIFISCDNVLTISKFSGSDPEVPLTLGGSTSSLNYPISKRFLFGLKLSF